MCGAEQAGVQEGTAAKLRGAAGMAETSRSELHSIAGVGMRAMLLPALRTETLEFSFKGRLLLPPLRRHALARRRVLSKKVALRIGMCVRRQLSAQGVAGLITLGRVWAATIKTIRQVRRPGSLYNSRTGHIPKTEILNP